jgi:hydrogenase accessory protein HypB
MSITKTQTVAVNQDIQSEKKRRAQLQRDEFTQRGTLVVNLVSSPGAGKTSLLEAIAKHCAGSRRIAVLVGDLATERDADRLRPYLPVEQLTTGGACHLELSLVQRGLELLPAEDYEFLFIENIGNLVCPASHDLAEHVRVAVLSVTEGDDKPGKYPKMFRTSDALVISKCDLLPHVPFSVDDAIADAREIQPDLESFSLCALTDEGVQQFFRYLDQRRNELLTDQASVVRVICDRDVTIRAGRGIAPLTLPLDCPLPVLAVGGHQKVAVAICDGKQAVLGPDLGDLDSLESREEFERHLDQLYRFYQTTPQLIAHDAHPDYFTTRWAKAQQVPTIAVQHHHAHVVAGMLEHGWLDRSVLGIACDGTGYGTDGTIWGGEFLLATAADFQRVATFRPLLLPGGELAVLQPWRVALSMLTDAAGAEAAFPWFAERVQAELAGSVQHLVVKRIGPTTSSLGRIFDAVASLILQMNESAFQAEPAIKLESVCDRSASGAYSLPSMPHQDLLQLDWRPMMMELLQDLQHNVPTGTMAMRFHRGLADAFCAIAAKYPQYPTILTGGCFQNQILTELVADGLNDQPQPVGLPGIIPPNDGGLAAGQLAVASAQWKSATSTGSVH